MFQFQWNISSRKQAHSIFSIETLILQCPLFIKIHFYIINIITITILERFMRDYKHLLKHFLGVLRGFTDYFN